MPAWYWVGLGLLTIPIFKLNPKRADFLNLVIITAIVSTISYMTVTKHINDIKSENGYATSSIHVGGIVDGNRGHRHVVGLAGASSHEGISNR
jgi:hypothetical protein